MVVFSYVKKSEDLDMWDNLISKPSPKAYTVVTVKMQSKPHLNVWGAAGLLNYEARFDLLYDSR